jgi:hypothetical protein
VNPQEPIYEGPKCACDEKSIRKIRALLRSTIDSTIDDLPDTSLNDETVREKAKKKLERYEKEIIATVKDAASKAKGCLGPYPEGVLAVSLISGITKLWGPDFEYHRISAVLSNDNILLDDKECTAEQRLTKLQHSPVHAIYRQPRDHRPLWTRFEKPEEAWFRSEKKHFNEQLYEVECPAAARTYTQIADNIVRQHTTETKIRSLLLAVGKYLDNTPVFGVFSKPEDMTKALLDTAQAFTTADGRYLWVFGFDIDRPPSPYRAVVVSTDNEAVERDPNCRRWLNTLAAILGEIAAVERSMAIFVNSVKAKAFAVKRNEERWKQISGTHETQNKLCARQKALEKEEEKEKKKEEEKLSVIVQTICDLLPTTSATIAHRHTVLSMRHYQVPSFRDILLQYRTIETSEEAKKVFSGILRTLGETFYAHNTLKLGCSKQTYEETRAQYVNKVHLDKFRERSNQVTTHLLGLRKSPHTSTTHLRLLDAIEVIYGNEPLTVTYHCGEGGRKWQKRDTLPVYSVLEEVKTNVDIKQLLKPPQLHWTHGDLHFGNILLDVSDLDDPVFKLIDQGVDITGRDIANDLSKLLQSCDGLGDFIQEGLFDIKVFERPMKQEATPRWMVDLDVGGGEMMWPLSGGVSGAEVFKFLFVKEQVDYFNAISADFQSLVQKQLRTAINSDPLWFLRAQFTEALNMLTSPPFFLQKDIPASLAFAVTGAIVLTDWCSDPKVLKASPQIRKFVKKSKANKA